MRSAQSLWTSASSYLADPAKLPPHSTGPQSAGWLRWFFVGAVALIIGIAWMCLRGYRNKDSEG
ncbi:MAG: hypothetical protein HOV83_12920 [Catenulispora sp.]|nr:hypothetical protein [Catenulispora sp.]